MNRKLSALKKLLFLKCANVSKNLLPITAQTQTLNGVTFTVANNGTITVNADGSATAQCNYLVGSISASTGDYIMTGCPEGGNIVSTYGMQLKIGGAWKGADSGDGITFSTNNQAIEVYIIIRNGYKPENLVFKPVIRSA